MDSSAVLSLKHGAGSDCVGLSLVSSMHGEKERRCVGVSLAPIAAVPLVHTHTSTLGHVHTEARTSDTPIDTDTRAEESGSVVAGSATVAGADLSRSTSMVSGQGLEGFESKGAAPPFPLHPPTPRFRTQVCASWAV